VKGTVTGDIKNSFSTSIMQNQHDDDDSNIYDEVNTKKESFDVIENSCYATTNSRVSSVTKPRKTTSGKKVKVILFTVVTALLICTAGACIAFTLKIIELQSAAAKLGQDIAALETEQEISSEATVAAIEMIYLNISQSYSSLKIDIGIWQEQTFQNVSGTANDFQSLVDALNRSLSQSHINGLENLENTSINVLNQRVIILEAIQGLQSIPSCAALPPSSPSGYYWVTASNGSAVRVYCDMTRSCGGITGGWTRVIELDMRNSSHQCPSGLRQRTFSGTRTCARNTDSPGCSTVFLSATSQYSNVCGKITAYQHGSPNTFEYRNSRLINGTYVDGVSLTYGSPRTHIWSFAAGLDEVGTYPQYNCVCTNTNLANRTRPPPAFVGNNYFCDTTASTSFTNGLFYSNGLLWDGTGCGPLNTCCSFNNPPWFYKQLSQPTTDDIEMRVCRDQEPENEDVLVEVIELYVQ
jgi:hypothetical protein